MGDVKCGQRRAVRFVTSYPACPTPAIFIRKCVSVASDAMYAPSFHRGGHWLRHGTEVFGLPQDVRRLLCDRTGEKI
jgi:hypothetical protein